MKLGNADTWKKMFRSGNCEAEVVKRKLRTEVAHGVSKNFSAIFLGVESVTLTNEPCDRNEWVKTKFYNDNQIRRVLNKCT